MASVPHRGQATPLIILRFVPARNVRSGRGRLRIRPFTVWLPKVVTVALSDRLMLQLTGRMLADN